MRRSRLLARYRVGLVAAAALLVLFATTSLLWLRSPSPVRQPVARAELAIDGGEAALREERQEAPAEPAGRQVAAYTSMPRLSLPHARLPAKPGGIVPVPPQILVPPPRARSAAPRMAIVLDDMGHNYRVVRRASVLPAPLTLAFLPYVRDIRRKVELARRSGKEIFLHMPMQPMSRVEDPGPDAIRADDSRAVIGEKLERALRNVPGSVGLNNHMGSRATASWPAMRAVMAALREHGLLFLDSLTSSASVAGRAAAEAGILHGARDLFIDNELDPAYIRGQLARAERIARRVGRAIVIGHPHPQTLATLESWIPGARKRGIRFVPASDLIREASCSRKPSMPGCGSGSFRSVAVRAECSAAAKGCPFSDRGSQN